MTLYPPPVFPTRAALQSASERALLLESLQRLTSLAAHSPNLFASPLGPLYHRDELFMLPRHLFIGENAAEEAWRMAIYAGFSGTDTRAGLASLRTLERLALEPKLGESFNLAFNTFVNPSGLADGTVTTRGGHHLLEHSWADSPAPELQLLKRDALTMQYDCVFIVRSEPGIDELRGWLRGFAPGDPFLHARPVRGTSKAGYLPFKFPVQWESHPEGQEARTGPLTLADDLRRRPFEVTLLVPAGPALEWAIQAVSHTVRVFLNNFRTAVSTGMSI
jgi:hypothetical protein